MILHCLYESLCFLHILHSLMSVAFPLSLWLLILSFVYWCLCSSQRLYECLWFLHCLYLLMSMISKCFFGEKHVTNGVAHFRTTGCQHQLDVGGWNSVKIWTQINTILMDQKMFPSHGGRWGKYHLFPIKSCLTFVFLSLPFSRKSNV
jgi:hypothetical protein